MIEIRKSPTADTRTCDFKNVTIEKLHESSVQHINDVREGLQLFIELIELAKLRHDFDKLADITSFYSDFLTGFKQTTWWDRHRKINRHHINMSDGVPDDINLVDVIEHIVDCVMAGMARSGFVYELKLSNELLQKAFKNTTELLKAQVNVTI